MFLYQLFKNTQKDDIKKEVVLWKPIIDCLPDDDSEEDVTNRL